MIKICYLFFIFTLYQTLTSRFCTGDFTKEKCALYKNSRFLWWGSDCGKFCHQAGQRVTCMWYQYHVGCFCKRGFFRNRNWDCVPLQGCYVEIGGGLARPKPKPIVVTSPECPPNEIWNDCGNLCMNLCESINNPRACRNKKCEKGCFCKGGMLRNYNGACIRKDQCSLMMISGSTKSKYCMSISLSLWMKKFYKRGTQCQGRSCQTEGYPSIPSNQKCLQNEEFTTCGDKCIEQCRNLYMTYNCPLSCNTGCFCKTNYYRNNQGVCVAAQRCPGYNQRKWLTTTTTRRPPSKTTKPTPPPHRPHATYGTTSTTTEKPVRNVSDSECPVNEEWSNCGSHCQELCENVVVARGEGKPASKCPPNMNCMDGCFCKPGFYRNLKDFCVPKSKCPRPPPPTKPPINCPLNEHYSKCGSKCSESCSVFNETLDLNCPQKCDEGCFCIQGFYRDSYEVCVPQDQCECDIPPQKCPNSREVYSVCGKNCRQTCEQKHPECRDTCARGCFCKEGLVYNENGVCTLPSKCGQDIRNGTKEGKGQIVKPNVKCPANNEKWSECGNLCGDYCVPKFGVDNCTLTCEAGCFCRKGYLRNVADQCVLIAKCDEKPECAANEEYSECGSNCAARCKDIGKNRQCPLICEKGCYCKWGYFRDDEGQCIPRAKCVIDTTPDCGNNEVYRNCSTHCGNSCEDLRNPVECPKPEQECDKGCFCDEDYYRDIDGVCGTILDCNLPTPEIEEPSCEGNEVYKECGNRCFESCEESIKCKKTCESGCFCIEDYLRNKKGECVPSEKCKGPPQCAECKQYEYYTDCGTDCGRMCTDIGKNIQCGKDTPCYPGCTCKWGFYRTSDGDCVTKNECQFFMDEDEVLNDDNEGIQSPGIKNKVQSFSSLDNNYDDYNDYQDEFGGHSNGYEDYDREYGRRRSQNSYNYDYDRPSYSHQNDPRHSHNYEYDNYF